MYRDGFTSFMDYRFSPPSLPVLLGPTLDVSDVRDAVWAGGRTLDGGDGMRPNAVGMAVRRV
jgi:hypothetical protein